MAIPNPWSGESKACRAAGRRRGLALAALAVLGVTLGAVAAARPPNIVFVPITVPHLALQVPEESLAPYRGQWLDPPYTGTNGYLPHPAPRAAYAAMVTRLDTEIGRLMDLVRDLARVYPALVARMEELLRTQHRPSDLFPFPALDR
jgi:hypothetical protein